MPGNPFSPIILFSNPFNAATQGGAAEEGELSCGRVPSHPTASLPTFPRGEILTWGSSQGNLRGKNSPMGGRTQPRGKQRCCWVWLWSEIVGEGYEIEKPAFDVPVTAVTALLFHLN